MCKINDCNAATGEVLDISCSNSRSPAAGDGDGDGGDHQIHGIGIDATGFARGGNFAVTIGRFFIEGKNSAAESFGNEIRKIRG